MPARGTSGGSERSRQERRGSDSPVARTIQGGGPAAARPLTVDARTEARPTSPDLDSTDLIGRTIELDAGRTARVTAALTDINRPILLRVEVAPFGGIAFIPVAALESSGGAIRAGGAHLLMRGTEIGFYESQGLEWVGSRCFGGRCKG